MGYEAERKEMVQNQIAARGIKDMAVLAQWEPFPGIFS